MCYLRPTKYTGCGHTREGVLRRCSKAERTAQAVAAAADTPNMPVPVPVQFYNYNYSNSTGNLNLDMNLNMHMNMNVNVGMNAGSTYNGSYNRHSNGYIGDSYVNDIGSPGPGLYYDYTSGYDMNTNLRSNTAQGHETAMTGYGTQIAIRNGPGHVTPASGYPSPGSYLGGSPMRMGLGSVGVGGRIEGDVVPGMVGSPNTDRNVNGFVFPVPPGGGVARNRFNAVPSNTITIPDLNAAGYFDGVDVNRYISSNGNRSGSGIGGSSRSSSSYTNAINNHTNSGSSKFTTPSGQIYIPPISALDAFSTLSTGPPSPLSSPSTLSTSAPTSQQQFLAPPPRHQIRHHRHPHRPRLSPHPSQPPPSPYLPFPPPPTPTTPTSLAIPTIPTTLATPATLPPPPPPGLQADDTIVNSAHFAGLTCSRIEIKGMKLEVQEGFCGVCVAKGLGRGGGVGRGMKGKGAWKRVAAWLKI